MLVSLPYRNTNKKIMKELREIQAVLTKIATGKKVFFNITQYKNAGLVYSTGSFDSKEGTKWHLTQKGKAMMSI